MHVKSQAHSRQAWCGCQVGAITMCLGALFSVLTAQMNPSYLLQELSEVGYLSLGGEGTGAERDAWSPTASQQPHPLCPVPEPFLLPPCILSESRSER